MKKLFISLFFLSFLIISCSDKSDASFFSSNNKKYLPNSSGNLNNISVVISDELWGGDVGNVIRKNLSRPVYGLPQIEPVFDLSHIPTKIFSGFATKSRTILKIDISETEGVFTVENKYAVPQRIIQVSGATPSKIESIFNQNLNSIYSSLFFSELQEKQRRISKSLNQTNSVLEKTGVSLKFPSVYRIAEIDSNFVWIRKDIKSGSVNLFVCKYENNSDKTILQIRDSIAKKYIPGPIQNTFMSTDLMYKPNTQEIRINGKKVFETRGLWEVKGQFMAGPFLNYQIKTNSKNNQEIMLDGFVYSPGTDKREYIFELEAIMRSLKY